MLPSLTYPTLVVMMTVMILMTKMTVMVTVLTTAIQTETDSRYSEECLCPQSLGHVTTRPCHVEHVIPCPCLETRLLLPYDDKDVDLEFTQNLGKNFPAQWCRASPNLVISLPSQVWCKINYMKQERISLESSSYDNLDY